MRYLPLSAFITNYFARSGAPCARTIRKQIDSGALPGIRLGKKYFVDVVAMEAQGNPVVEKVLRDVSRTA